MGLLYGTNKGLKHLQFTTLRNKVGYNEHARTISLRMSVREENGQFILHAHCLVHAPIGRCFNLSRSVDLVRENLGMEPVEGRKSGLVIAGEMVRWEGWQLGMRHYHESLIAKYDEPVYFQDRMVRGRFLSFEHNHHFKDHGGGTMLEDELRFALPFGFLGRLVARHIMVKHILHLMSARFDRICKLAESEGWRAYVPEPLPAESLVSQRDTQARRAETLSVVPPATATRTFSPGQHPNQQAAAR